ncbi:hypothetical protein [Cryptosporangium aurantiacum]|uniref:Uncharacterized protein n=1 Tax=Cryptosporangium aurantiacum TaxID=134849 RepID=A0A1M7R1Y8_9ACTN|nr:hypothetical protein [Cryptosporangium aurantiacum]SHN38883.1 hypothetical protein SAMN05443668_106155 [Cryptosporangium aurantiacum]
MSDLILPSVPGSRVPPLPPERADPYVLAAYDKSVRTWGIPNNLIRTTAWQPGLARTLVDYANSFIFDPVSYGNRPQPDGDPVAGCVLFPQTGFLDRVTKELVINLVSLLNRSRYSLTHHAFIGYTTLCRDLPHPDPAERALRAEEMLLRLVDAEGRPAYERRTYGEAGEPLYTEVQLLSLRLAETIHDDPHAVTDAQFAELREVLRGEADRAITTGPLAKTPDAGTPAYLDAYVNGMLTELTWCIAHFDGLLNTWFTVLRVMDEIDVDADGVNFVETYNREVPERIKVRNNAVLGTTGWGR